MANDAVLNSFWSENYVNGRKKETLSPEENLISHEESEIWETLQNIFIQEGENGIINYFLNSSKKADQVEDFIDFFKIMIKKAIPIKISKVSIERLIGIAQRERQEKYYSPTYDLGKTLFGSRFDRLLRAK